MIAVLGAGPHGREIARWIKQRAVSVLLFDDVLLGYPDCVNAGDIPAVVGAAWPSVRQQIASKYWRDEWWRDGVVVAPGANIGLDVELGAHVHVNYGAVVAHGCRIGAFSTVCPNATLSGDVNVGEGVVIGAGAVVIHGGITIGAGAMVGAGAVVVDDVAAGATVVGVPARPL